MEKDIPFKYSVLMCVYYKDNPQWLKEAIDSMLNQTIKTNDFVIVEDGKLGIELNEVIEKYVENFPNVFNVIYNEKNEGLGVALAKGIDVCKNEWIARMDADDISLKNRIEEEYKIIKNKNVDLVGTNIAEFIGNIENVQAYRQLPEEDTEIKKYMRRRNPFGHPSVIFKKNKILEAGNFRNYYLVEDYDMWIRLANINATFYNIQENLVFMRINEDFYGRRGGIKYLKSILKFKKEQYDNGFFYLKDFFISSVASIITCLMPNGIREFIYKKILRKEKQNGKKS